MKKSGFVMSTYVYMLLVFFLLVILSMLAVLNNSRLLSNKLKEKSTDLNIVLIGNNQINLELGTEYIEPGYVAQTATGEELEVDITSDLDVTHVGTYSITYTAKKGTNTISETRTIIVYKKFVTYITNLYNNGTNEEGLEKDDTSDENIRYTGSEPKNYVTFNNELWRIIGIFNVSNGTTTEPKIKLVRNESIGNYSWDSSAGNNSGTHEDGEVNDGYGVNQWGASTYTDSSIYEGADLMRELNTLYLNQESGICYNGSNDASTACDFSTIGINDTYRGMIESAVWHTGAMDWNSSGATGQSASIAYNEERGTTTGQICKGKADEDVARCTDEVVRTTTWEGLVGLIYPSDYGYASTDTSCRENINDNTNNSCINDNWLYSNSDYWTLSPRAASYSCNAWIVSTYENATDNTARYGNGVRPSVYLKSSVNVIGGDGTQASPYQLNI